MTDFRYFERFFNYESIDARNTSKPFTLDRMRKLLVDFGNPEEGMCLVHVAGSKGKGLTSAYIAAILADALSEEVGLYSSPHLLDYRERFRVSRPGMQNYQEGFFSEEEYSTEIENIRQYNEDTNSTAFELFTLLAFLLFRQRKLNWAVIEVGLGGRLDSTNVITPLLSVITPLEIEHSQYLGNTIAEIAAEKAGIIKPGIPVLSQVQKNQALAVIRSSAEALNSPCYVIGKDIADKNDSASSLFADNCRLPAQYMRENAVLAYAALRLLQSGSSDNSWSSVLCELHPNHASESVNRTSLPGRFEIYDHNPKLLKPIVLDVAHTPRSISTLLLSLKDLIQSNYQDRSKISVIFSCLSDKKYREILDIVLQNCDCLYITSCSNGKRVNYSELLKSAQELKELNSYSTDILAIENPQLALNSALKSSLEDIILVCGSFYLVGDLQKSISTVGTSD